MRLRTMTFAILTLGATVWVADGEVERAIRPAATGPNRLEIDATLLSGSKALEYDGPRFIGGLQDFRLYDDSNEIPYLLVGPAGTEEKWVSGRILPIQPTKKASGFELDLGAIRSVDALRLPDLPAPFLKRFRLEGSGDRQRWTLLEDEGTMFDLPAEGLSLREVAFEPGEYRYLRVTWDDRSSGRPPRPRTAEARIVSRASQAPARFPVEIEPRMSEPGKSRFHLTLPAADLPARAVIVESSEETLSRPGTISEIRYVRGEANPVVLGSSLLRRVESDGAAAEDLRIPIGEPEGPELELVIDDGDNPPFQLERAFVELPPLPWIYFETESTEPLVARWGDPDLEAPRYDLEAKRERLVPSRVPEAAWGELHSVEPTPPSGEFTTFEGAPIDRDLFTWMKPIPASPPGLTSLLVDAETLAHSNDLADIRIVTEDGRQVPYLVERRDEPLEVPLEVGERVSTDEGRSSYEIGLPWPTVPQGTRLMLQTDDRVFNRPIEVTTTEDARSSRVLATAHWSHADPSRPPRPLILDPSLRDQDRIAILVDEGDNAPLEITGASLLVPAIRLRFIRDGESKLALMYGSRSLSPPRYDIDLLAANLFGRRSHEIEPGPEQALRDLPSEEDQKQWFWIVVALSAVALFIVIGRVLKG